jgi:hypothetical protein
MATVRVVDALTEWRARRWLSVLVARVGAEGMAVAASAPGLAASVDQHAAAVRDILLQTGSIDPLPDRVLLAGYGRGLLDRFDVSIEEVGRYASGRWTRPDWLALRLLAVCTLARSLPVRPVVGGATPGRSTARH